MTVNELIGQLSSLDGNQVVLANADGLFEIDNLRDYGTHVGLELGHETEAPKVPETSQ